MRTLLILLVGLMFASSGAAQTCGERSTVMLMIDRSRSMSEPLANGRTKWSVASEAIETMLNEYGDIVNFGLMIYPYVSEAEGMGGIVV